MASIGFYRAIRIINRGCRWKSDFKVFSSVYFLANVLGLALMLGFFGINPRLATDKIPQIENQV